MASEETRETSNLVIPNGFCVCVHVIDQLQADLPRNLHENCLMQLYVKIQAAQCHCTTKVKAKPRGIVAPTQFVFVHGTRRRVAGGGQRGSLRAARQGGRQGWPLLSQCAPEARLYCLLSWNL